MLGEGTRPQAAQGALLAIRFPVSKPCLGQRGGGLGLGGSVEEFGLRRRQGQERWWLLEGWGKWKW